VALRLVSFATPPYYPSQRRLERSARRFGVASVRSCTFKELRTTEFYRAYRHLLDQPRGAGYWLWKPYLILENLKQLGPEDVLIYLDSDVVVTDDLAPLAALCTQKRPVVLVADHGHRNFEMTRRDCFHYLGCDAERYHRAEQVWAGVQLYRNTPESLGFVESYLASCCDERVLVDGENRCGLTNLDGFVDHRHDQSVLSLLAERADLERVRNPSQWGNHLKLEPYRVCGEWLPGERYGEPYENSPYGTLLDAKSPLVAPLRSRLAARGVHLKTMLKNLLLGHP
jgi:hypothetical protein